MYPEDFYYAKTHEWIKLEGETATIGITDFAQKQLGDVVYVEMPEKGAHFDTGQSFGVIESVKAVSDLYLPVSGEVAGVNEGLNDEPELVNNSPHDKGWIIKVKVKDPSEVKKLMGVDAYEKFLEGLEE